MITIRSILLPFLLFATIAFSQENIPALDTISFLKEVIRVSDSLRDEGNFRGAVHQLKKGLNLYRKEPSIDLSKIDYTDTLVSYTNQLPHSLYQTYIQRAHGMKYKNHRGVSKVYHREDSSLFSGYIVHILAHHYIYKAELYKDGSIVKTHSFQIFPAQRKATNSIPFSQFSSSLEQRYPNQAYTWKESIQYSNKHVTLSALQDTLSIAHYHTPNNIERIQFFNATKDTLEYYVEFQIGNEEYSRNYALSYGNDTKFYYTQTQSAPNVYRELTLNQTGDTLYYDQYMDDRQHGLQLFGDFGYEPQKFSFRLMWKKGKVVDILNTNILYLKNNLKEVSEEKYLREYPIDESGMHQLYLDSDDMLRLDENGKIWIVIPYKVRNGNRFLKKLNESKWKPLYPSEG